MFSAFEVFLTGGNTAQAAASVTLTASGYSDPDAEDAHKASQWVVRNPSSTVFDSGTDTTHKLSITLASTYFTAGTTYWWKVRYQDEHDVWSDYSDEASFVYTSSGASAVPSSGSSATSTVSGTTSATASATVATSETVNPWVSATTTASVYPCGPLYCVADLDRVEGNFDCDTGLVTVSYRMYNATIAAKIGQTLNGRIAGVINDIYIVFEENNNYYERIANNVDYTESYRWETLPGYSWSYLTTTVEVKVPATLIAKYPNSKKVRLLVHSYENLGQSWGDSVSLVAGWSDYANPSEMAARSNDIAVDCPIVIGPDIIEKPCLMEIITPRHNDEWLVGEQAQTQWQDDQEYAGEMPSVSIALSRDGGRTVSDPLLVRGENSGLLSLKVLNRYRSGKAVLQYIGFDRNGEPVSFCQSERFKIKGPWVVDVLGRSVGKILPIILFLGALLSAIPLLLLLIAMIPAISRLLSRLGVLFMPPAWPKERPAWGIVYDAVTKKPLQRVIMRIYSEPDGKARDVQTSNERGEFGFLVPRGKYSIIASASGYSFPTHIIVADTDGKYHHLYRGGKIFISASTKGNIEKAPIQINIPLDPSRLPTFDIAVVGFLSVLNKFTSTIRYPIMIIGTLASVYLVVKYSRFIDWFILALYVILWALELRDALRKKAYGLILDERGNPVDLAIVRIVNMRGKIMTTVVTGDDGKFQASVNPGTYRFDVVKPGYTSTRSEPYRILKLQDLHRVKLRLEKIAKEEGAIRYRTDISS